jgi:D-arginine dehydrogenase
MDVHALHQGFLRGDAARRRGALVCDAPVLTAREWREVWRVRAGGAECSRPPVLVNAAGAWADEVARRWPARSRSGCSRAGAPAFVFEPPAGLDCAAWPMTAGADEDLVLQARRRAAAGLAGQRRPRDPAATCSPRSSTWRWASTASRRSTTLQIRRPRRTWAGLRSFVADGDLVGGCDRARRRVLLGRRAGRLRHPDLPPRWARPVAALVRGQPLPAALQALGLTPEALGPQRLRQPLPG